MKYISKNQVDELIELIEKLAGEPECCAGCENPNCTYKIDFVRVIKLINNEDLNTELALIRLWKACGYKPLQTLLECGWESIECIDENCKCGKFPTRNDNCEFKAILKSPQVNDLLIYIYNLFIKK